MCTQPVPESIVTYLAQAMGAFLSINGWRAFKPFSASPLQSGLISGFSKPKSAANFSASGSATTNVLPFAETAAYSTSGWTVMPKFAGSVHGVVVQITISAPLKESALLAASSSLNATQIEGETWSLYSISASAKAVAQGIDQYTGFLLR